MMRYATRSLRLMAALFAALAMVIGMTSAVSAATISAKALTDHACNANEWHFVITQIDEGEAKPSSISVTWANGDTQTVPLGEPIESAVAHYTTTANLDSTVTSATAEIYDGWGGEFDLSHGPCGETPTETSTATQTATATETPTETATMTETPTTTQTATTTATMTTTATTTATATGTTPTGGQQATGTATLEAVAQLPTTGSGGSGSGGGLATLLLGGLAILLAAGAWLTRRQTLRG